MQRTISAALGGLLLTCACGMAQTAPEYLDITRVQVRGDKVKDFEDTVKKMAEANRKYHGDHWLAVSTEYGEFGRYSFATPRANMAAVEDGMGAFRKAMKEAFGPLSEKILNELSADSASGSNQIEHRRWDLSANPPLSAGDLMKLMGQTRWIRMLTVNMKPGRSEDYIEAWKPFMEELKRALPGPVVVSEASTGSPAMYFAVYYKSWAEMDAANAGVRGAVASDAYRRLMAASAADAVGSNWQILRIRPELSNPPDEIAQVDPAFWRPKPAAAAKPKPAPAKK